MSLMWIFLSLAGEEAPTEKKIIYRPSSEVELQTATIEGEARAPEGLSDLKQDEMPQQQLLNQRLGFKPWDTTRLGY